MKKFLLFLTLFLSAVGLASAAESSTILCDFTASTNIHKLPNANVTTEATYTSSANSDLVLTLYYAWWQKNTENSYLAFKKTKDSGKQEGYVKINPFKDKIVTSLTLTFGSNNIAFDILLNDDTTPIGKIESGSINGTATINIPVDKQNKSNVIIIKTANINNQIGIKKIEFNVVDASTSGGDTKPDPVLTFSNTEVTKYIDELSAYKGESLTTNPANLEITYSVSPAEIASIDSKSGELIFTGATGVATITAVSTETTTHKSKSATYTVSVSKRNPSLAFDETTVELSTSDTYAGQAVKYTLLEGLAKDFTINYKTSNSSVANVNELTGAVTLTGAEGTATITAYGSGNTYYTDGSASYTIKVAKQYIWSDTKAVLVTDASTLKAGDVIIIANQAARAAMSTSTEKDDKRPQTSITLSTDKSEITSISSEVLLLELGQVEVTENETTSTYWTMKALNYTKDGLLYCGSTKNEIKIGTPISSNIARAYAKITIEKNNAATILFNKGTESSSSNRNNLRYNNDTTNGLLFACYESGQQPVYIYKVVTPKTIEAQTDEPKFVESSVKLTNKVQLSEDATADNYAVLINGTQVGVFAKVINEDVTVVTVELTNAPYLPEAKYTICPVLAKDAEGNPTTLGHPEELTFTFPTLPTFEVTAMTPKWYYSKFYTEDGETYANLDLWIYMTPSVTTTLGYTFAEFDNSVAGTEIWGWYDENKDQLQNCKYNFLTKVPVTDNIPIVSEELLKGKVATATFTPVFLFNVDSKYSSLISGSTRAAAPALLAEGAPILVQEVNGTKISESIEVSELIGADVSGVESVVVEGVDGAVEYYNMQGVRVEGELAPGMYIRRQGRSVSKVQIR